MKTMTRLASTALLVATFGGTSALADWPQWRGPDRTDVSKEAGLLKQWPGGGPKVDWIYKDGGLGYAGFAVVGDSLYTMGARGDTEMLIALNVKDGTQKWSVPIGALLTNNWGDGPRGTPTVDGDYLYTLSGQGNLVCAKTSDGTVVWKASMLDDLGGKRPGWGYTESPLVDGNKVVVTPGGSKGAIAAFDKTSGKVIWQSKEFTEGAQYSSIIAANHNGKRQYIQLTMNKIVGLNSEDGSVLWVTDFPGKTAVIPTPIFHDGHVYVAAGYGVGCKVIKIGEDNKVTEVYRNDSMVNHHGGVVLVGDHLYGYSDKGGWTCQDFKTGKVVWTDKKLGKGAITYADGKFYLLGEGDGQVVLIDASPAGWKEAGRFTLTPQTKNRNPKGKVWTHPVIANGKMYLRDQELIFCFDVKGK